MKTILQAAGLLFIGIVIWAAVSSNNTTTATSAADETPQSSFAAVRSQISLGMRKWDVRSIAGSPDDSQHDEYQGYNGRKQYSDYWYYDGIAWQLVFENGRLTGINRN